MRTLSITRGQRLNRHSQSSQVAKQISTYLEEMSQNSKLTPMEKEIFRLVCRGKSNYEIAEQLFIVEDTVKKHMSRILMKFGSRNRVELLAKIIYPPIIDYIQQNVR